MSDFTIVNPDSDDGPTQPPKQTIEGERLAAYLRMRERGFSDRVAAAALGVSPSYFRRVAGRDPAFREKRSMAIALGVSAVFEMAFGWISRALETDSKNAPYAYRQLMHLMRMNHPHLSKMLPSDDDTLLRDRTTGKSLDSGTNIEQLNVFELLQESAAGESGGPLTKAVRSRVLGLPDKSGGEPDDDDAE